MGGGTRSHSPVSIASLSKQSIYLKVVFCITTCFCPKVHHHQAYLIHIYCSYDEKRPVFIELVTAKNDVQQLEAGAI